MKLKEIDPALTFKNAVNYEIRTPDQRPRSNDEIQVLAKDLSIFFASMIKKSKCPTCLCAKCRGEYPGLANFEVCPFCGGDIIVSDPDNLNDLELDDEETALSPMEEQGKAVKSIGIAAAKEKLNTLGRNLMENAYEMGEVFQEVFQLELWKEDPDQPNCVDFRDWCEFNNYSFATAERLMKVTKQFSKDLVLTGKRLKISGFIELSKAVEDLPAEKKAEAVKKTLQAVQKKGKVSAKEVKELAEVAREEVLGEDPSDVTEEAEIVDVTPTKPAQVEVTPVETKTQVEAPDAQGNKFKVKFTERKCVAIIQAGDILRIPVKDKNIMIEVKLTASGADCYWYSTE